MMVFLYVIGAIVGLLVYFVLGIIIGATLCRRSSASWRWINSNIGEFIMSMHPVGLIIYLFAWPLQVGFGLILASLDWVRKIRFTRRPKSSSTKPAAIVDDVSVSSLYPTVVSELPPDHKYRTSHRRTPTE